MIISKEIEITGSDFTDCDLIQELEDRIENNNILYTEEYQKKREPEVAKMLKKLTEIHDFLTK